jgi:hypothetical protein
MRDKRFWCAADITLEAFLPEGEAAMNDEPDGSKGSVEDRLVYLEKLTEAQSKLNAMLFQLVFTNDPAFGQKVAEVLRLMLIQPTINASPELVELARAIRATIVLPVPKEVVEASRKPPLRPVD